MPVARSRLRLDDAELDELMTSARTAHVATVSPDGTPHVVPLWFVWHEGTIWVNNLRRSKRSANLSAGSPVSVCVDDGVEYAELRGAVFSGRFVEAADEPGLTEVRRMFGAKYWGGIEVPDLKSHVWLRLGTTEVASWDFKKIPAGRDKRLEATRDPEA